MQVHEDAARPDREGTATSAPQATTFAVELLKLELEAAQTLLTLLLSTHNSPCQ